MIKTFFCVATLPGSGQHICLTIEVSHHLSVAAGKKAQAG